MISRGVKTRATDLASMESDARMSARRRTTTGPRPGCPDVMFAMIMIWARVVFAPVHSKRALLIAFVVGSWLNLFNHGDELMHTTTIG